MLAEHNLKTLNDLVKGLSPSELIWVNGYLNGLVFNGAEKTEVVEAKPTINKITIAYGTETGNAKKIATEFAAKAKKTGINVKLVSLDQYRLNDFVKEEYFFTVVSTHGDGEPPAATKKFYDHIHLNGFKVDKLKYGVLALGDTSYPLFCKTGEDIDDQLNKLGGSRITPLRKCDVEFEEEASDWVEQVLKSLVVKNTPATTSKPIVAPVSLKKPLTKKIYTGTVLANINLNDKGSNKETYHIELGVQEPEYEPGDSVGIVPENSVAVVDRILHLTQVDRDKIVSYKDEQFSIEDLLQKKVSVFQLATSVVKKYGALVGETIPEGKIDLENLLHQFPAKNAAQYEEALLMLNPIAPRLYTIASSPAAHADEVHLTVERDHFHVNDEQRFGLCSEYLGALKNNSEIRFFVQKNKRFRLPAADKDTIMIGPGTGIAAFRSFLAERDATGATGRNWLFFGEEQFATDFLYQTEIQNWVELGVLTKVNVAFSKDHPTPVYVQDKMLQHAEELFSWLEKGAYLYLCGQKDPMSIEVEKALLQVFESAGNKTAEEAKTYFDKLKEEGRFGKDVY